MSPITSGRSSGPSGWPLRPRSSLSTGRRSCSAAPREVRTGSSANCRRKACVPSRCTAIARRVNASVHWTPSPRAGPTPWWRPTSWPEASTSTTCPASCTSIRRLITPTTSTVPGAPGRAGRTGTVVSLVTEEQRKDTKSVQRALGLDQGFSAPFSSPTLSRPVVKKGKSGPSGPSCPTTMTGTVKFFNGARGYGFLAREEGDDLFVHHSQIEGDERRGLAEGSTVEFTIAPGRKGDEARNVRVVAA